MTIQKLSERTFTTVNIENFLKDYLVEISGICAPKGKGLGLLSTIKRDKLNTGPYPKVSLFEAANRIMSDLVILHGISYLLKNQKTLNLPFTEYQVELGIENKFDHDICALAGKDVFIAEAFNAAPDFFPIKRTKSKIKLDLSCLNGSEYTVHKFLLCNKDCERRPDIQSISEFHQLVVDIRSGNCDLIFPK